MTEVEDSGTRNGQKQENQQCSQLDKNCSQEANSKIFQNKGMDEHHLNGIFKSAEAGTTESDREDKIKSTENLVKQIESIDLVGGNDTKLRYESEAYVLKKRRNNLFRSYERKDVEEEQKKSKDESGFQLNHQKRMTNKNSQKIYKLLSKYLLNREEEEAQSHLEFISGKYKIPLEAGKKAVNTQIGYKQSDLKKVVKYQLRLHRAPVLGNEYDAEDKKHQELGLEDDAKPFETSSANFHEKDVDCFEDKKTEAGYSLPSHTLRQEFAENRRAIFKVARSFARTKQEKEAVCKKLAHLCMKEVERRYLKSLRSQNNSVTRAKKLHRQGLLYWRKREKELIEVKKKTEKLEAELKKRQEEEQEAKKQEKRLQYIMYQSGLYSHFMATKLGMEGEQKKELEGIDMSKNKELDIDEEAAQMTVNQIINSKQDNLENFSKPEEKLDLSSVEGKLETLTTPTSFNGKLKEYQVKGLRWLNNLFEQGINGILADEMGLGKTIQAIALLAHVSQNKNVWGPFLIIAPNSTLFNWQQEFKKFCPSLRVLPYWGNLKQRKTLRKFFSPKKFTEKPESPFHVVITSYQLTVTDDKVFKKMKWQFMILDEAQAIKNILSQRWNTLKEFHSRNRLLLTGTPIQNNMAELWALLNFVMPDLFDSHELFNEWFSKDIEAHSQDAKELDTIKIQRLHAILKPFMLRRVKKDVEHEIGKKIEHQILCEMTKRQKLLYDSIKEKLNVKELFRMFQSKAKVENLMNLVMQLRKVCNHPELFERRPSVSPFLFQDIYYYTGNVLVKGGEVKLLTYNCRNPIQFSYPKLAYDELHRYHLPSSHKHKKFLNVYEPNNQRDNPTFSVCHLMGLSQAQVEFAFREDEIVSALMLTHWLYSHGSNKEGNGRYMRNTRIKESLFCPINAHKQKSISLFNLGDQEEAFRSIRNAYIRSATALPIEKDVSAISYYSHLEELKNNKFQKYILYGQYKQKYSDFLWVPNSQNNQEFGGILKNHRLQEWIEVISFGNLISDSSKLRELDRILKEKKRNGDKVLIFCQMTKMIDILEDFMNMKKYSFFRLDGACNISDRRDMVNEFQKSTSKTFVFLLSTRAGGLGVTLTAANAVIFYDNDWNPTMDAQATDRAHRIGQSRDVNVYQLVTKNTIEERIVKRAQQKKTVQSTVYEGASFNFFKKDMILELMADEFDQNGNAIVPEDKKKDGKEKKRGKPPKNKDENKDEKHPEKTNKIPSEIQSNKENEVLQQKNEQKDPKQPKPKVEVEEHSGSIPATANKEKVA